MALLIFTITIFVSAFLLFLVQPMVGKLILPKLGGTPQVWNTCMVFFQSVLLAGYAYTHSLSTRFKLRQQLMIHSGLLVLPLVMMFFFPMYTYVQNWDPPTEGNPVWHALFLLAVIIGIPFFVVSTSAPLLQKWFGYSGHEMARDPYFLYSASNAGSLLSLFFYPTLIEPWAKLPDQSAIWFGGYAVLAGLVVYCAYLVTKTAPSDEQILALETAGASPPPPAETPVPVPDAAPTAVTAAAPPAPVKETGVKSGPAPGGRGIQRKKGANKPQGKAEESKPAVIEAAAPIETGASKEMTSWRRIRWVLLAAVPSSLMLGVTAYISTDLSPFPLVWVIPLALYLLSFILVYTKFRSKGQIIDWTTKRFTIFGPPGYTLHQMVLYIGQPLGLLIFCFVILRGVFDPFYATPLVMLGFFATALSCHGELALDRPNTKHLTEYFLLMSVGGMVGGVFNGIIAPIIFQHGVLEFYIAIVVACVVRPQYIASGWFDELVLQAFPKFQGWVRDQGDEMAKSMGRPARRSTYLFSFFLDIAFGLFVLAFSYWLTSNFSTQMRSSRETLVKVMQFFQVPITDRWMVYSFNALAYAVPMLCCFFFAGRPLRLTLAVAGLLLANMYFFQRDDRSLIESRRTYFGLLRVTQDTDYVRDGEENVLFNNPSKPLIVEQEGKREKAAPPYLYTFLMHGTTYHGRNYYHNINDKYKDNRVDLSRLATTYYHRYGPVGVVMEQFNWFAGAQNTFYSDARLPASMIGNLATEICANVSGLPMLPLTELASVWSEPPFATIGLGTGTMASYGRPYGNVVYYEIDEVIRGFSLPPQGGDAHFTYVQNAVKRGVNLEVIMGDARQSLEPKREPKNSNNSLVYFAEYGPKSTVVVDEPRHSPAPSRNNYYQVIVVDAFSSDAIPIHLCTKEAIEIYLSKLTPDGVLCMHTSNRHMDLVRPVARIASELGVNCLVGKDRTGRERYLGLFSSEYVMLYRGDRFKKYVEKLEAEKENLIKDKVMIALPAAERGEETQYGRAPNGKQVLNSVVEWYNPYENQSVEVRGQRYVTHRAVTKNDALWTDDYSYILGVLR